MNQKNIIIGAVIAGAVGSLATAMLCSNRRSSFMDTCEEYGDKIKSVVNDYAQVDLTSVVDTIKDQIRDLPDIDNKDFIKGVVIGAALAGLVSSGTRLFNGKQSQQQTWFSNGSRTAQDLVDLAHAGLKCWNKFTK